MPREVAFYHSAMPGAPAAATYNTAGKLIEILDACLVNGFNSRTVTGITQTGGVATLTTSVAHGFSVSEICEVAGADQANYNGKQKILSVPSATTLTFAVSSGTVSPATGTMTVRYGPAGWTKPFAGTNTAIYRTQMPGTKGHYIQIDNNNPYADSNFTVGVKWIEGATGFNAGTYVPTLTGRTFWSNAQWGAQALWIVVADGKTCHVITTCNSAAPNNNNPSSFMSFGEFIPTTTLDAYPNYANGWDNATGFRFPFFEDGSITENNCKARSMRHYTGVGEPTPLSPAVAGLPIITGSICQSVDDVSLNDGDIRYHQVLFYEFYNGYTDPYSNFRLHMRGRMPGVLAPGHRAPVASYPAGFLIYPNVTIGGVPRDVLTVRHGSNLLSLGSQYAIAFDLGETWT
jgi:hypothetical protein